MFMVELIYLDVNRAAWWYGGKKVPGSIPGGFDLGAFLCPRGFPLGASRSIKKIIIIKKKQRDKNRLHHHSTRSRQRLVIHLPIIFLSIQKALALHTDIISSLENINV